MMSLGDKIRDARKRKNYTQEQLANLVGVKKNTITGYEKNVREPDVEMLKKLIQTLDIPSAELLELPSFEDSKNSYFDHESLDALAMENNISISDRNVIKELIRLDEVRRNTVLSMIRGLVDTDKR